MDDAEQLPEDLVECLSNAQLSKHFKEFGKELNVLEPKSLEDVYKTHLENTSAYKASLSHEFRLTSAARDHHGERRLCEGESCRYLRQRIRQRRLR